MTLELSNTESEALRVALGIRLQQLQDELVHTDDRTYRRGVREAIEQLESVLARFASDDADDRDVTRVD
jgi:hypothetical protein